MTTWKLKSACAYWLEFARSHVFRWEPRARVRTDRTLGAYLLADRALLVLQAPRAFAVFPRALATFSRRRVGKMRTFVEPPFRSSLSSLSRSTLSFVAFSSSLYMSSPSLFCRRIMPDVALAPFFRLILIPRRLSVFSCGPSFA